MKMKKKRLIVVILSLIFALSACCITVFALTDVDSLILSFFRKSEQLSVDKRVAAVVNGEKIYLSSVQIQQEYNSMTKRISLKQIDAMSIPEEQKEQLREQQNALPLPDAEEILQQLIRSKVMLQTAAELGIEVDEQEAFQQGALAYQVLKEAGTAEDAGEADKMNYQAMRAYMEEHNLTEQAYLEQVGEVYQRMMTKQRLFERYCASEPEQTDAALREGFERYLDNLVENADVKIY